MQLWVENITDILFLCLFSTVLLCCIVKNMLDTSDMTIAKFKHNMPGPGWENHFIKVSCLKVNNACCGDK